MHLHEVLKIEVSFHAQSCTFNRPRLNSAHIGVACPLFFYTPLVVQCIISTMSILLIVMSIVSLFTIICSHVLQPKSTTLMTSSTLH